MSGQSTSATESRGVLARIIGKTISLFRRMFRKQSNDNPNIYPFF
jgi:hypothetical protein